MEGQLEARKNKVKFNQVLEIVQSYKNLIDQPLDEGETEEDRILLVGQFYVENIKNLDCSEFDLNAAFSMVFG